MKSRVFLSVVVCAVVVALVLGSGVATGALIVVPSGLAATEGNTANPVAGGGGGTGFRFQQVIAASVFPGPVWIIGVTVRPDGALVSGPFTVNNGDLLVQLSTTTRPPDGLAATYALNIGPDVTTVFNGPATTSVSNTGPAGGPKAFNAATPFTTPFLYDPAAGNLLLDRQSFSGFDIAWSIDGHDVFGDSVSAIASSAAATVGGVFSPLVLQFEVTPEPSTLTLLALGTLGVLAYARRRRRTA